MKKAGFFLIAAFLGFFLFTSIVYCEHICDEDNRARFACEEDEGCPLWLTNLVMIG